MALAGYKASVYATTTPSVTFTNEATTDAGDHKNYTITNATKRYWDKAVGLTIQTSPDGSTGWTTVTSGFTVTYLGQIIFTSAVSGTTPSVRVSGSYLPYSVIGSATSVDLTIDTEILDSSTLGNLWKTKIPAMVGGSIKLKKWFIDGFYFTTLSTQTRLVVSTYTGANANQRFDAFAYLKSDGVKIAVNALVEEDLDFDIDGQIVPVLS